MARFNNTNSFVTGRITNVASSTPVQGAANEIPPGVSVVIKNPSTNTGVQTIGSSSANALNTGTTANRLQPGESLSLQIVNVNRIWADSTVTGEHCEFTFEQ